MGPPAGVAKMVTLFKITTLFLSTSGLIWIHIYPSHPCVLEWFGVGTWIEMNTWISKQSLYGGTSGSVEELVRFLGCVSMDASTGIDRTI